MVNRIQPLWESRKSNVNKANQIFIAGRKLSNWADLTHFSLLWLSNFNPVSSPTRKPILIAVLEATREDLERQIRKLNDSVPEDEVQGNEQREGYVAYGSYAKSVIVRKENLRDSLGDITEQTSELSADLRTALDALDSFERVRARQMAAKAEKALRKAG